MIAGAAGPLGPFGFSHPTYNNPPPKPGDIFDGMYPFTYLGKIQKPVVQILLYNPINENYTEMREIPEDIFFQDYNTKFRNTGSQIPENLLKEVRFNVEKQKENLTALEENIPVELSSDVKNKILSNYVKGKIKQHYKDEGDEGDEDYKESGGGRFKKSRKFKKMKKTRKGRKTKKSRKNKKNM
jgi:hypothetical protein